MAFKPLCNPMETLHPSLGAASRFLLPYCPRGHATPARLLGLSFGLCSSGFPFKRDVGIYELQSKLLKGGSIGDYIGDYYRGD